MKRVILSSIIFMLSRLAEAEMDDDLRMIYKDNQMQSIASGHPLPNTLSPSVTSVITEKDIERIGARRLTEVLEYLPGVHVSSARDGFNVIGFRGVWSEANQQILMMINGVPLRDPLFGGKPPFWDMPIKNIARVEVIRGPGSMLYGGDAISGVINVILKNGSDLKGGNVGTFVGSNDTYEGWAQYGNKQGELEYSLALQGGSTNGDRGRVDQDAQSLVDQQFGTNVSKAPGYTNNGRDDIDARLDVAYKNYRLRGGFQRFNHIGTGVGAGFALDDIGSNNLSLYTLDGSVKHTVSDDLKGESGFYMNYRTQDSDTLFLPEGTFGGQLPQGERSKVAGYTNTAGIKTQITYSGIKKHNIVSGTGLVYNWGKEYKNQTNFFFTPTFVAQIPFTDASVFGLKPLEIDRLNYYALVQDEWSFAPDWFLTTGFRYDYYSDVQDGFSPRFSLVWNTSPYLTTKLIYSRSFRPPAFYEQRFSLNQTKLKPEKVNTIEFQIENNWSSDFKTSANAYWFELDNLIFSDFANGITPVGYINKDKINGIGMEAEANYSIGETVNLSVNYSYHGVSNTISTGFLPEHMAKALVNWNFTPNWMVGAQVSWIGERRRASNDQRNNLSDYFLLGLTLSTKITEQFELTLRGNNILGMNAREPSLLSSQLPGDIPTTGRTVLGQIKWSF